MFSHLPSFPLLSHTSAHDGKVPPGNGEMDVTTFQVTTGVPLQVAAPTLQSVFDDLLAMAQTAARYALIFAAILLVYLTIFLILLVVIAFRRW